MDKVNIMYDHYKETCLLQRDREQYRNKLFIILCILILILMLMTFSPDSIYANIKELILNMWKINIKIELLIIELFIWLLLVYITIRYYQLNSTIEKNYIYIQKIETSLESKNKLLIYREGRNYLDKYPMFLDISYYFYKFIFPAIYILILITKIILDLTYNSYFLFICTEIFICVTIIILNISYISFNYEIKKGDDD